MFWDDVRSLPPGASPRQVLFLPIGAVTRIPSTPQIRRKRHGGGRNERAIDNLSKRTMPSAWFGQSAGANELDLAIGSFLCCDLFVLRLRH